MPRHATRRLTATKSPKVDPGRLDQAKVLGGRTVCSGLLGRERDRAAPRFARSGEALYAVLGGWSGLVSRAAAWSVAEGPCAGCSDSGAAEHLAGILARESSVLERIRTVEAIPEPSNRSSLSPAYTYIDHSPPRSWPTIRRPSNSVTAKSRRPLIRVLHSQRECGVSFSEEFRSADRLRCAQSIYPL
jgi:hypothetical protein